MWHKRWMVLSALLAVGVAGCGGSNEAGQAPAPDGAETDAAATDAGQAAQQNGPDVAVRMFLEAVRAGDRDRTSELLTSTARQVMDELGMVATPSGSRTAEFEIGQVEYLGQDGARVACTLSDLDVNAQRRTERLIWMVRLEEQGWRIAGVAAIVAEGPPQALNFESREQMAALNGLPVQDASAAQHGAPNQETSQVPRRPEALADPIRR